MRLAPALAAAFVAFASSPALAWEAPPGAGPYTLELVDESGRGLPAFERRGQAWVLGRRDQRYLLRVRNGSGRRIEVVASVDGRDVVDGRKASYEKRGYIVDPWSEVVIDGFRLSQDAVAAFRFSSVRDSYAARTGDARDVGVIGAAIFPERRRFVPRPPIGLGKREPAARGEDLRDEAAPRALRVGELRPGQVRRGSAGPPGATRAGHRLRGRTRLASRAGRLRARERAARGRPLVALRRRARPLRPGDRRRRGPLGERGRGLAAPDGPPLPGGLRRAAAGVEALSRAARRDGCGS